MRFNLIRKHIIVVFFVFLVALFPLQTLSSQSPEKIEPPFWWAGLQSPDLQIMFHGKDIGLIRLEVNHPGVVVKEVVSVQSPNCLFVYLDLAKALPGVVSFKFNLGNKTLFVKDYHLLER